METYKIVLFKEEFDTLKNGGEIELFENGEIKIIVRRQT